MKKMIFPTAKNAQEATFQCNVIDRAVSLFHNGYTVKTAVEVTGIPAPELWQVISPEGTRYVVDGVQGTCDCPCFTENKFCKHYGAMEYQEEQVKRLEAEYTH